MTVASKKRSQNSWLVQTIIDNPQVSFTIVVAILVGGYFSITQEGYFSARNAFAILEGSAVLGLVTIGLTVTIIAGEIDLSIGSMAALIGVIVVQLNDTLGPVPALLVGLLIATVLGALQGFLIKWLRISAIVFTVGTLMLLRGVTLFVAGEQTVVLRNFEFGDFLKTRILLFSPASIIVIIVFIALGLFLNYHKWGREIYATGGARKEALAAGLSLTRPMILVFAISAFCAGLAGAIVGLRSGSAQPLGLQDLLLTGTTAAFVGGVSLLGGKGSAFGAALGTLTIRFLVSGLNFLATPSFIANWVLGVLLMIVIIVELAATAFDRYQTRRALLAMIDERREIFSRHRKQKAGAD